MAEGQSKSSSYIYIHLHFIREIFKERGKKKEEKKTKHLSPTFVPKRQVA